MENALRMGAEIIGQTQDRLKPVDIQYLQTHGIGQHLVNRSTIMQAL